MQARKTTAWVTVWSSTASGVQDTAWSLQTVDISAVADGAASLQIRFMQNGGLGGSAHRAGWNVDKLIIKSSSTPDFDACGACGGAPSFEGAASAADASGCADTGILVSWHEATAWGTGHAGTYSVYRDTSPSFVPGSSNRVATGVAGTSWSDAMAPNGVTLYYVVRAENDETCSTGPANGGVTDANLVRVSARDDVSQPPPGDVGATLAASPVNAAHVRLTWSAAPQAARYHVYRSASPAGPWTRIADVAALDYEDLGQIGNSASWSYRVLASDSCGNE